jgi:hypothetical protein
LAALKAALIAACFSRMIACDPSRTLGVLLDHLVGGVRPLAQHWFSEFETLAHGGFDV